MKRGRKRKTLLALLVQTIISLTYFSSVFYLAFNLYDGTLQSLKPLYLFAPSLFIICFSLILEIILIVRSRIFTQEALFPMIFLFISLSSVFMLPYFSEFSVLWNFSPTVITFISRCTISYLALLFTLSSLLQYGMNTAKLSLYLLVAAAAVFFISYIMPFNTTAGSWKSLYFTSRYDSYLALTVTLILLSAILTNFLTLLKSRTSMVSFRALGSVFIIAGYFLSLTLNMPLLALIGTLFYLIGVIFIGVASKLETRIY